jgi:hypothetical protein
VSRVERCGENAACLRSVYGEAVARGEVVEVLAALDARGGDCHLEAHRLAHAVHRDVGDVERTFLLGGPQCRLGYLHGAVEASGSTPAAAGAAAARGVAIPRCTRFRARLQAAACAHGFGHALMLRTRHDLRASLDGCAEAATHGVARPSCEAGVFMQNSLRHSGAANYLAASSAGCAEVAGTRALAERCFDGVGLVAALDADHDPARASAVCAGLPVAWQRSACERGAADEIREAGR